MTCLENKGASVSIQNAPETAAGGDWTLIVERVAAALDIAPNVFAQPEAPDADRVRILAENAEALEIFAGITGRDARQRSLAYLRWIASNPAPARDLGG